MYYRFCATWSMGKECLITYKNIKDVTNEFLHLALG